MAKPGKKRAQLHINGFSFDAPVTFYAATNENGFCVFLGGDRAGMVERRDEIRTGERGRKFRSRLVKFQITEEE